MLKSQTAAVTPAGPRSSGVRAVVYDPEMYGRISDDTCPPDVELPDGPLYLLGEIDDKPAAVFIAHGEQIHFMVLQQFRGHALRLWRAMSALANMPRMYCLVPICYPEAIAFGERVGFRQAGVVDALLKGGAMVPRVRIEYGYP